MIVKHAEVHDAHDPELIARYNYCSALKVRRRDISLDLVRILSVIIPNKGEFDHILNK